MIIFRELIIYIDHNITTIVHGVEEATRFVIEMGLFSQILTKEVPDKVMETTRTKNVLMIHHLNTLRRRAIQQQLVQGKYYELL